MVVGTSIVVVMINIIACIVFEKMASFEKKHTVNDETYSQFMRITMMQFINIAVIILVVNIDLTPDDSNFLGFIPIFNGDYEDFTVQWYDQVGKTICTTLLINIFSPHGSKLMFPALKVFKRILDRGCCRSIKKEEDQDGVDVNTKQLLQDDLNDLYTGDQISSHYVYAQNFTYFLCVMTFSTGIPLLYFFGFVFFFLLFWVYKFLLLKYYARTHKFNEQLPLESIKFFKYGIFIHLLIGGFMVTYSQLLPDYDDEDYESLVEDLKVNSEHAFVVKIMQRFFNQAHGIIYVLLAVILLVLIFMKNSVLMIAWKIIKFIVEKIGGCCCGCGMG